MRAPVRSVLLASALGAAALIPQTASAGVTRTTVEGPSTAIATAAIPGNDAVEVDVAPDGSAAVAYRKLVAAVPHVFVARYVGGAWLPPEQVDVGGGIDPTKASQAPALAVGLGGRVVVVFANGTTGSEDLYGVVRTSSTAAYAAPKKINPVAFTGWQGPNVEIAPNGDGYVTAYDNGGFDLWAERFTATTSAFTTIGATKLNQDINHQAGPGEGIGAKLGVDATGATGTMAWGEGTGVGGQTNVWARKLTGSSAGPAVDARIPTFRGHANDDGQNNDIDVAVGGGTTWVAQHVSFAYGAQSRGRTMVSRFTGTAFDPAQEVDGIGDDDDNSEFAKVAVGSNGAGLAVSYRGKSQTIGSEVSSLANGTWGAATAVSLPNTAAAARSTPAIDANGVGAVASYSVPTIGAAPQVVGRVYGGADGQQRSILSDPAFGDASAPFESGAGNGQAITAFLQGTGATTRLVAAVTALPPTFVPTPTPIPTTAPAAGTNPPGGGPAGTPAPLTLTGLAFRKASFPRGKTAPAIVSATSAKRALSFTLGRAATVTLTVATQSNGRTSKGRCVAQTSKNRKAKACKRLVPAKGSAVIQAPAGTTNLSFSGTLTNGKQLATGKYTLTVSARDAAGIVATPASASFTLTAAKKSTKK